MHLYTERLSLRPVTRDDLSDLFRIYGDPATNTFNPAGPYPDLDYARRRLDAWLAEWERDGFGNMAVCEREIPDRVIGFGGLSIREYNGMQTNNLGYRFQTESWGKGIATEFCLRMIRYGFEVLDLPDITAVVRGHHLASQKVALNAGLDKVGEVDDVAGETPSLVFRLSRARWQASQT